MWFPHKQNQRCGWAAVIRIHAIRPCLWNGDPGHYLNIFNSKLCLDIWTQWTLKMAQDLCSKIIIIWHHRHHHGPMGGAWHDIRLVGRPETCSASLQPTIMHMICSMYIVHINCAMYNAQFFNTLNCFALLVVAENTILKQSHGTSYSVQWLNAREYNVEARHSYSVQAVDWHKLLCSLAEYKGVHGTSYSVQALAQATLLNGRCAEPSFRSVCQSTVHLKTANKYNLESTVANYWSPNCKSWNHNWALSIFSLVLTIDLTNSYSWSCTCTPFISQRYMLDLRSVQRYV